MTRYKTANLFESEQTTQEQFNHIIRVAFESGIDAEFDYFISDELWPIKPGQRVEVPFGRKNKLQAGFCVETDIPFQKSYAGTAKGGQLKKVNRLIDKQPLLDSSLMELAGWTSKYYICPLGQVLAAMIPAAVKKDAGVKKQKHVHLTQTDQQTIAQLKGKKQKQIVASLQQQKATDKVTAVELNTLLSQIGCTKAPVKKLLEKKIIQITHRTIISALPAIPAGMAISSPKVNLNNDQRNALSHINNCLKSGEFSVSVLHGVTDSGKTEIYIRAIQTALKAGKSVIVLLPEITLTTQTIQRFSSRFKKIAVMHSGLSASQRNAQWQKIKTGDADIVIGARSAVFAPLSDLGIVIVDEEYEPSYKQDTAPRYNARNVAIKRAQLCKAHCILGSATPSLETIYNCTTKKHFSLISLPNRVMNLPMPKMKLVDMHQAFTTSKTIELISKPLREHLESILAKKEQAILLLNKRGYSNFLLCPACKYTPHCRNCDVTLTFHKSSTMINHSTETVIGKHIKSGMAICHYCGAKTLVPQKCPLCNAKMVMIGFGSQRLEEEVIKKFPNIRIARVDSDSMAGRNYYRVLQDFSTGRINILVGTQMLAKGLHFPNVTVVGIISADTCLQLPDFRANERTVQLISQVAGRAGRSKKSGTVYIQTFLPEQLAIQFALKNDYKGFVKAELENRKACHLPPFWRLAIVILRDRKFDKLETASQVMRERIDDVIQRHKLKAIVTGPMPAVISRIKGFHRMQIVIQTPEARSSQQLFKTLKETGPIRPAVTTSIDIDPY